jgi:arylsulfatase A-like enzyme
METFDLIEPPRLAFARARERMAELSAPRGAEPPAPFFLFLHTFEVHSPYAPSAAHASLYADPAYAGEVPSSREALDARAGLAWEARHELFFEGVDRSDPADVQHLVDLYDASIHETDALLGGLFEAMEREGRFDDTIVVLLSDHGEEFMEHGRLLHSQLYRELLHVPLIVALPKPLGEGLAGTRVEGFARLVDVAPTLLDWLGVPIPREMQGATLVPMVEGAPAAEPLVASTYRREGVQGLQLGIWKLIERRARGGPDDRDGEIVRELYDLSRDPAEENDVAASRESVAALLARRLERIRLESRAVFAERGRGRRVIASDEQRAKLRALGYLGASESEE